VRSAIAYTPRPGRLGGAGALAASLYLGSLAVVAFVFSNPVVLAGAAAGIAVAGLAAGAGTALLSALRWSATLSVLIVVVNGIASQRGDSVLIRGWELPVLGRIDVSAEALAEAGVLALRIGVVLAVFAVHTACVDPDRMMRLLRPLARHSALTASLITRLVPLAAADAARLGEARSLRGPGAAPVGRAVIARRLVAGSLDRAVDIAAALELRGYARGVPGRAGETRASRYSWRFAVAGAVVIGAAIAAWAAGVGSFEAYPTVSLELDAATVALSLLPALAMALPYAGAGRARRRGRGASHG
jgi:energy-coupling factor transport system permease protein